MDKFPDKKVYWDAISPESVKSYEKFIKEYPDKADRVTFVDSSSDEAAAPLKQADEFLDSFNASKYNEAYEAGSNNTGVGKTAGRFIQNENTASYSSEGRGAERKNIPETGKYNSNSGQMPNGSSDSTLREGTASALDSNKSSSSFNQSGIERGAGKAGKSIAERSERIENI